MDTIEKIIYDETLDEMEKALENSDNDRLNRSDYEHQTRTLTIFLISSKDDPYIDADRIREVLKRVRMK